MIDILLIAVNARHSHTSLSVRYLHNALAYADIPSQLLETTINQPVEDILEEIMKTGADRLFFSCYIWNREVIQRVGMRLRALKPDIYIALGGPEVSFEPEWQLEDLPWADAVYCGEGERMLPRLLKDGGRPRGVHHCRELPDMDWEVFPYDDLNALRNRVLYYESSRGCPYGCAYCLSAKQKDVRWRPMELVKRDLMLFNHANVMRVKFVDRTFNANNERALEIWRFLAEIDNGVTSYQMEVSGALFTEEQISFLASVRPGLFQFEMGVQSTCPEALKAVSRNEDFSVVSKNARAILRAQRQHLHIDLIAGLPKESFSRFGQSFDDVIALRPQQLQLGFLKLLRGSPLWDARETYNLRHSPLPPYEILENDDISYAQLCQLRGVERVAELFYNSGRFAAQIEYLISREASAFAYFCGLAQEMPSTPLDQYDAHDLLYMHAIKHGADGALLSWLMLFDICRHERPRRLPRFCAECPLPLMRATRDIANAHGVLKHDCVYPFPADLPCLDAPEAPAGSFAAVVFSHGEKDIFGHAAFRVIDFFPWNEERSTKNIV